MWSRRSCELSQSKSQWALESLRANFRPSFSFRLYLPTSSIINGVADKPKMGYIRESLPPWTYLSLKGSVGVAGNEGGSQEFSLGKLEIYVKTSHYCVIHSNGTENTFKHSEID